MLYFFKRYQKYLLILFCAIIIFVGVYVYNKSNTITTSNDEKLTVTEEEKETNNDDDSTSETVFVDIKGAVNAPGVYELDMDYVIMAVGSNPEKELLEKLELQKVQVYLYKKSINY